MEERKFRGELLNDKIIWEGEGEVVWLETYGKDSIRFRSSKSLRIDEEMNWTLIEPEETNGEVFFQEGVAVLKNGKIRAEINVDGVVRFFNDKNKLLLEEHWLDKRAKNENVRTARNYKTLSGDIFSIDLYFKANDSEYMYGMGHDPNDVFGLKGTTTELLQKNTKITVPYYYSTCGYGFLWNNPGIGRAEFVKNHTMWHLDGASQIDYIVIAGDSPNEINNKYTQITGRSSVLPEWATGFWQSKLRYETQDELLSTVKEYKKRKIPLDIIVIDFFHWTQQGEWKFDEKYWPNPKEMIEEIKAMGIKVMVSVWPTVDPRSENYEYMKNNNMFIRAEKGVNVFFMMMGAQTMFDPTSEKARKFVWSKAEKNYFDNGVDLFWLDEAEPEMWPYDYDNLRYSIGNGQQVSSLYPFYYAKTFYDGIKSKNPEKDVVNLIRCAWLGIQRFDVVVWTGDIQSTFNELRKQLKAGLNFSFCGIPWWTTDIGGFYGGNPKDNSFKELMVRWFQFGTFSPIMRNHGNRVKDGPKAKASNQADPNLYCASGGPNEIWDYGQEAYSIIKNLIELRERLKPYIKEQMEIASREGTPVMRPLLYDYNEDKDTFEIWDEYMFGNDILVAPITYENTFEREVYLPVGSKWTCANTKESYDGGQKIIVKAPLNVIPVFVRDDAKVIDVF
jgi:alpha-D-xyloside xylohydrolase